jgi:tripartite-type tricarboxylate transporter receptor subunit TctC
MRDTIVSRRWALALALGTFGLSTFGLPAGSPAAAQDYPDNRPITLVVPFAPGGGTDIIARELGKLIGEKLGQPVIIENKGGAGGIIGAQFVAKSKPDGHTLLMTTATFLTAAAGQRVPAYDVEREFTPVSLFGRGPMMVVVNKQIGVNTLPELLALAKSKPNTLNFASSGTGSIVHFAGELFVQRADVKMTHVPYKGTAPAMLDMISGQVQVYVGTVPSVIAHVKSGKLALLAVAAKTRMKAYPDTPTVDEAGVKGYEASTFWGITGPAGLPAHVISKLDAAVRSAVASEAMQKRFEEEGAEVVTGSPGDFGKMLKDELAGWRQVVKDGNLWLD